MGKTVVLISSKGGSGKSTVAVGLATAFSNEGKSVLLIDADEGARCLDSMLSIDGDTVFDIRDVLNGDADISTAAINVPQLPHVSVIPSPLSAEPLELEKLGQFVKTIEDDFDYVIIDTKGQLPAERLKALPNTFSFISVVSTDSIAVRNTGVLTAGLKQYGIAPRLIINRFKKKDSNGKAVNIDGIIDLASARLLGVVPEDKRITGVRGPLLSGIAAAAVFRIASRIDGKECHLPKIKDIL
ncbi:MAG: AAA family ATPase [Clostridia bacterium]|nr:AAA family ATPase [Clostridia bacterium]